MTSSNPQNPQSTEQDIRSALGALVRGEDLSADDSARVFRAIMAGAGTPAQIAGLLTALAQKGETVEEITGAATAMREAALQVPTTRPAVIDTCGTGGSGIPRVNVSTAAAIVTAACGTPVAKHGNRAATSKSGSADVLEALGVNIDASPEVVGRCVDELGVGFLFARSLHPAMKYAGPVRRELGIRTIFNLLGPLTNPAGAKRQLMGVFHPKWCRPLASALVGLGSERVFIVHGFREGVEAREDSPTPAIDDLSPEGITLVAEGRKRAQEVEMHQLSAKDFGLPGHKLAELAGGDGSHNAAALQRMLEGEKGAYRDAVLQASAMALLVAGEGGLDRLPELTNKAAAAIDDGSAQTLLDALVRTSKAPN